MLIRIAPGIVLALAILTQGTRGIAAGDVTVVEQWNSFQNVYELIVQGDGQGNSVRLIETQPGVYNVIGLPHQGQPTTVNGGGARFTSHNVHGALRVWLAGGDDRLMVDKPLRMPDRGSLDIEMGDGDDFVQVQAVRGKRGISVHLGDGKNSAQIEDIAVGGWLTVIGGVDTDTFHIFDIDLGDTLNIHATPLSGGGMGTDYVSVKEAMVGKWGYFRLEGQRTELSLSNLAVAEHLRAYARGPQNRLDLSWVAADEISIGNWQGEATVRGEFILVANDFTIDLGDETDTLELISCHAGAVEIEMGAGDNDLFRMGDLHAPWAWFSGGAGAGDTVEAISQIYLPFWHVIVSLNYGGWEVVLG